MDKVRLLLLFVILLYLSGCATIAGTAMSPVMGFLEGFGTGWKINPILSLPLAAWASILAPFICFTVGVYADVIQFLAGYGDLTTYKYAFYFFTHPLSGL